MSKVYDSFQDAREKAKNDWIRNFTNPYGSAFNTAHISFYKVLEKQEKDRQKNLSLAMFALSFAGGSFLTSVFGSASAKSVVAEVALDTICRNEWEKAFKVAGLISENKTASFALGLLADKAGSIMGDSFKKLAENPTNYQSLTSFVEQPRNLQNHLENWVRDVYDKVLLAGSSTNDQYAANEGMLAAHLAALRLSPFFIFAPLSRIDDTRVALEIELSFFMKYVIELDQLAKGFWAVGGGYNLLETSSRKPIDARPSSKEYPKTQGKHSGKEDGQEVKYKKLGAIIRKHIEKLHMKVFKAGFFQGDHGYLLEEISAPVIERAYRTLEALGNRNRSYAALKMAVAQP